jgi:hypothetical protein
MRSAFRRGYDHIMEDLKRDVDQFGEPFQDAFTDSQEGDNAMRENRFGVNEKGQTELG